MEGREAKCDGSHHRGLRYDPIPNDPVFCADRQ